MPTAERQRRWFHLTPDRFVVLLIVVEGLLWLAGALHWFGKGWAVLTAVATVGVALLMLLLQFVAAMILRWRFQFSIRSLLMLTLAAAISCGWLSRELEQANAQNRLVNELEDGSGYVTYDTQNHSHLYVESMRSTGPVWLRNLIGRDFFDEVEYLDFSGPQITDSVLLHLERLPHLDWLSISGHRGPYRSLIGTQITDYGLAHLEGVHQLKYLFLPGSQITDAGLKRLGGLTQLKCLDLSNTKITSDGIKYLRELKQLITLDIGRNQITDTGLDSLAEMHELQDLDLRDTEVTDLGLKCLEGLSNLVELELGGTQVTNEGVMKLGQKLPNCKIGQ